MGQFVLLSMIIDIYIYSYNLDYILGITNIKKPYPKKWTRF